ncbi:hypothetical protein CYY_007491 [Polysphondylium violaceum]|uniref:Uncharacterized protein n=1 Tax=Polysphondylium violaceum TaxID=133409 RepID=A0A8J4V4V3_9MYCE|nr:hypothetical protein CYY_007491 [Polysphondylium violaceum]
MEEEQEEEDRRIASNLRGYIHQLHLHQIYAKVENVMQIISAILYKSSRKDKNNNNKNNNNNNNNDPNNNNNNNNNNDQDQEFEKDKRKITIEDLVQLSVLIAELNGHIEELSNQAIETPTYIDMESIKQTFQALVNDEYLESDSYSSGSQYPDTDEDYEPFTDSNDSTTTTTSPSSQLAPSPTNYSSFDSIDFDACDIDEIESYQPMKEYSDDDDQYSTSSPAQEPRLNKGRKKKP